MMFIVISDIVSLRYRTWFQGLANTTSGIAAMVGPVVGGVLSDKLSWRWCFLVNIPLGAIAFFILAFCVSFPSPRGNVLTKLRRLDWLGMILLTGCVVCFVTPLQLGGTFWEWDEPNSVGMFVGAGVLLMVFVVVEWKVAEEPFVPGDLFVNKGVAAMFAVAGGLGFTYFAVPYYISLFFQMCYGSSAIKAGIQSIPLVLGSTLSSLGGGYYISHSGASLCVLIYFGSILQFTGILLITFLSPHSPLWMQITYLFIAGLGLGFIVCSRLIGVQVIVKTSHVAMVTGLSSFSGYSEGNRDGTIFNNMIESSITSRRSLDRHVMRILRNTSDPREARRMLNYVALRLELPTPHLVDQLVDAFLEAFRWGYRVMLVWPVVTVVLVVVFVRRQRMRGFERLGR
ncbi:major facilitator superfamily domain-containing protein [Chytridium lagenaria]|nr:major facilitator superfamily domain-containing protein [Chytridium lagenaria]